jgi:HprK-related kinase A
LKVRDLSPAQLVGQLAGPGLRLRTGPALIAVRSKLPAVRAGVALHYAEHGVEDAASFADFHISVDRPRDLRRWFQPQVVFRFDGQSPFTPLPGNQGFPMLEWGMNWCLSSHLHRFLIIHAAVVERRGRALILPAPPGSGKSTLCAGLVWRGWRLLSDELTLIDPATGLVTPVPRPVSLKNASIDVIRAFAPDACFGPVVHETTKGSVAHFRPPADAVQRAADTARPAWVVLPRYVAGAETRLVPISRARAVASLAENAFNYHVHGLRGFETLTALVEPSSAFNFSYSRLDEAVATFDRLAAA